MAFLFRLETEDGKPAEPPTLATAVHKWKSEDTIPLGRRVLRVVRVRDDEAEEPPVLVVGTCPETPLAVRSNTA
jgi:hypothetical protein